MISKTDFLDNELASLNDKGLTRKLIPYSSNGATFEFDGHKILNFSSNDYLGLSKHPLLKEESSKALNEYGCGATASRLVSGHLSIHEELENSLAKMLNTEASLVFGSGFLANIGVLNAIAGRNDEIYMDKLNHASLIDGSLLSGAKCFRYKHKDVDHLELLLNNSKNNGRKIIVTDSIFSMDGDIAPIESLVSLSKKYGALLIVDEAHAIGVFGNGGGICKELGLQDSVDVIVGTLSKALGGYGGFAACSNTMRKYLINKARSFIYATGLAPACIGSAKAAIQLINNNKDMGKELLRKAKLFHSYLSEAGFKMSKFESQILPLHIGNNKKALALSKKLFEEHNILAVAIRPPTVPVGTARLRLSASFEHTDKDLKLAAEKIKKCAERIEPHVGAAPCGRPNTA